MIAINDIYASIQGEGVLAGTPMVIIRLQGCGVGCPWCDTKETWHQDYGLQQITFNQIVGQNPRWAWMSAESIAEVARTRGPKVSWALLTGGEPAEQPLGELVDALHGKGFLVALETSGTAGGFEKCDLDWICFSPKFDMPGGKQVKPELLYHADELKMVVSSADDILRLMTMTGASISKDCVISLQPVSMSKKVTEMCVAACLENDWRLSIQTHRYIDVR